MQVEDIREALRRQPFQPFSLLLADSSERYIGHPHAVAMGVRRAAVFEENTDALSILDLTSILSIEYPGTMLLPRVMKKQSDGGKP